MRVGLSAERAGAAVDATAVEARCVSCADGARAAHFNWYHHTLLRSGGRRVTAVAGTGVVVHEPTVSFCRGPQEPVHGARRTLCLFGVRQPIRFACYTRPSMWRDAVVARAGSAAAALRGRLLTTRAGRARRAVARSRVCLPERLAAAARSVVRPRLKACRTRFTRGAVGADEVRAKRGAVLAKSRPSYSR